MTVSFYIDVSRFQNDVNWSHVKWAGIKGATIKASEGTPSQTYASTRDYFRREFAELRQSGLTYGAYHVVRSSDTKAQIDWFLDQIVAAGGNPAKCVLQIDYEKWDYDFPSYAKLEACIAYLRTQVPNAKPILYTGKWIWDQVSNDPANAAADLGVRLWDSHYVSSTGGYLALYNSVPISWWTRSYGGWTPTVLQFTSKATVYGVSGYCDVDAFRSTDDDFRNLFIAEREDDVSAEEVWNYDPGTGKGIANPPWRTDAGTNLTVSPQFAIEETWREAHEANERSKTTAADVAEVKATLAGLVTGGVDPADIAARVDALLAARLAD